MPRNAQSDSVHAAVIERYEYIVTTRYLETPSFSAYTIAEFPVPAAQKTASVHHWDILAADTGTNVLKNGANYLYLRAVDEAGNTGAIVGKKIMVDGNKPASPLIVSTTHSRAQSTRDAVPYRDASFSFSVPSAGMGGVARYIYELYTETMSGAQYPYPAQSPVQGETSVGILDLPDLSDNETGEFYLLKVKAIGANRRESDYAEYRFRVDTNPPDDFRLFASPHANPEVWYGNPSVTISWMRPELENSGIAGYRYILSDVAVSIPAAKEEQKTLIQSWTACATPERQSNSVSYPIDSFTDKSGVKYFYGVAIDTAGNLQFDDVLIRFDREKPSFADIPLAQDPGSYGPLSLVPDSDAYTITAGWGEITDGVRGTDGLRVETTLVKLDVNGKEISSSAPRVLPSTAGATVYEGLEEGAYQLRLRVINAAGNEKSTRAVTSIGTDVVIPESILSSFTEQVNGFQLSGTILTQYTPEFSETYESGEIVLPETFSLLEKTENDEWVAVKRLSADEITSDAGGELRYSFTSDRVFRFDVGGLVLEGSGLSFTQSEGLSFVRVDLVTNLTEQSDRVLYYGSELNPVSLSFPPLFEVDSCSSRTETEAEDLTVGTVLPDASMLPSWLLSGIRETWLEEKYWILKNAYIQDQDIVLVDAVTGEANDGRIELTDVMLDSGKRIFSSEVVTPFYISLGGSVFRIDNAALEGNKLKVFNAALLLDSADYIDQDGELTLGYFSVDSDGNVAQEAGFSAENVEYRHYLECRTQYVCDRRFDLSRFYGKLFYRQGRYDKCRRGRCSAVREYFRNRYFKRRNRVRVRLEYRRIRRTRAGIPRKRFGRGFPG